MQMTPRTVCRTLLAATIAMQFFSSRVLGAESTPGEQLQQLFAESWEFTLAEDPLFATHAGDARYNDRLPRETLADQKRRDDANKGFLARLEAIPREKLSREEQINYDIFRRQKRDGISEFEFLSHLMAITNRSGFTFRFRSCRWKCRSRP
jgi:uncharacterized protein (DUF885 family)